MANPCKYIISGKSLSENEFKAHLLNKWENPFNEELLNKGLKNFFSELGEGEDEVKEVAQTNETEGQPERQKESKEPPLPPIDEKVIKEGEESPTTAIKNAAVTEKAKDFGIEEKYEKVIKKDSELRAEIEQAIEGGFDAESLIDEILDEDKIPSDVEQGVIRKYLAGLEGQMRLVNNEIEQAFLEGKPKTLNDLAQKRDIIISKLQDAYNATKTAGRELGRSLRSRRDTILEDYSLSNLFIRKKEANAGAKLTPEQINEVQRQYEEIERTRQAYEDKIQQLQDEKSKLLAEQKLRKDKEITQRQKRKQHRAEKSEEIKADLKSAFDELRSIAKKQGLSANPISLEMLPAIGRITKDLVKLGINKLEDVVDNIYNELKDDLQGLTKRNVRDAISGYGYEQDKKTFDELKTEIADLRHEAKLLSRLEDLQSGKAKEKSEIERRSKNKAIEELQQKIKDFKSELRKATRELENEDKAAQKTLEALKKRTQKAIEEIQRKIEEEDFDKKEKPVLQLDDEAIKLRREYAKAKENYEYALIKDQLANRKILEKAQDWATEIIGIPRSLMSSIDFSAPLRQGLVASVAHPILASKAFVSMFQQAFSSKSFDDFFLDLKESPDYELMEESGLYISDPHNPTLRAKEEQFMSNLAHKIPLLKHLIKGSERAYVGYLNKLRVDLFRQGVRSFAGGKNGMTFNTHPEVYKAWASFVNNSTGRGGLGGLEKSAQALNIAFFSPRLIASRVNLLANPWYYGRLPRPVAKKAAADMVKFIAFGASVLALAGMACGLYGDDDKKKCDIELDPRSSDFGKIRIGKTRYDIWGGFQQFVVLYSRLWSGNTKSTDTGKIRELSADKFPFNTRGGLILSFTHNKLAPVTSLSVDLLSERTGIGEKIKYDFTSKTGEKEVNLKELAARRIFPLMLQDSYEGLRDEGIESLFTITLPATFGVGVQTYGDGKTKK